MSLALLAIRGRHAIVATDGAAIETRADGTVSRVRDDCHKFRILVNEVLVAATGTGWMVDTVYAALDEFCTTAHSLDDVRAFLSARLPAFHVRDVERLRACTGVEHVMPGAAVALVGYDPQRTRARLLAFGGPHYAAVEGMETLSIGAAKCAAALGAANAREPWSAMRQAMVDMIVAAADTHEHVGGNIYTVEIAPPPVPEPGAVLEMAGTYIDYVIALPAFGAGPGRVTFTVTAPNRVSAQEAIDVPTQDRDTVQITLHADVIASTTTTIDVQLTALDPLGGSPTISVASTGTPAITATSLGSNQWRLAKPAWNTASGRVIFQAVLAGRTTATEGVTVPPQTSQSTNKVLVVPAGAFQPADTSTLFNNFGWVLTASKSGGIPANTVTLSAYLPLPQGATITAIDMYSQCDSNGGTTTVPNILVLAKVAQGAVPTGTTTVTNATRAAVNADAGGLDSSTTISELVAAIYMLQLVLSGQSNHRFFSGRVYYTAPDLSTST